MLIPSSDPQQSTQDPVKPETVTSPTASNNSFDCDDNIDEFLNKIDASIASTKEDVKKTTKNSE